MAGSQACETLIYLFHRIAMDDQNVNCLGA